MLLAFAVMAFILMSLALCLHNHVLRNQLRAATVHERQTVRRAAEQSILASNTINPVLALEQVTRALEAVEGLHRKYGTTKTLDLTGVDTVHMSEWLQNQHDRILQDVAETHPKFVPTHPLQSHAGFNHGDAHSA